MVYQKREELEAELHNIHKRELSSEPHVKKYTSWALWATISSTTLGYYRISGRKIGKKGLLA
jgi:hypothetical protein